MVSTLQEHFNLNRASFQLNPKVSAEDRKLFFGSDFNIERIRDIENSYLAGEVPRFYMYGTYGTGKTHLLYHLKDHFERNSDPVQVLPLIVQVEALGSTRFHSLHRRMLDAVSMDRLAHALGRFQASIADYAEMQLKFATLFPNENQRNAMAMLRSTQANRTLAWKWLAGERLSASEQQVLAVTTSQLETGELVELLVAIGELFILGGERLLFLIDEAESLHNVTNGDAQTSWHDAFRRLAGEDNHSVGWILAFYETPTQTPPGFMTQGDILDRLGDRGVMRLEALPQLVLRKFLSDLLTDFVITERAVAAIKKHGLDTEVGVYPFTRDGFEAFLDEAKNDPDRAIPRTIIRAVTSCAIEALRKGQDGIGPETVREKAPAEFRPPT